MRGKIDRIVAVRGLPQENAFSIQILEGLTKFGDATLLFQSHGKLGKTVHTALLLTVGKVLRPHDRLRLT